MVATPALIIMVFGLIVVAYVAASIRLDRFNITAPMVFTMVGTMIGWWFWGGVDASVVHSIAEVTLALILFHDAAQVRPRHLKSDAAICARLLLVGLPLTIATGLLAALVLMPDIGIWPALLLAAALAPTDAGLGAPTVLNPVVPVRVRRILNVESGLNDGLCTPVVLFAVAASGGLTVESPDTIAAVLLELVGGVVVGVLLGGGCGRLLAFEDRKAPVQAELLVIATLAIPLIAYYGSIAAHSNGFVAAFVAGTAFAAAFTRPTASQPTVSADAAEKPLVLTAWVSTALGYGVWFLFGAVGVARLPALASWAGLAFAVLSLTALRMVPVAVCLLGTGFRRPTMLFVGWFGPRGLASVIFALIAVEELPTSESLRVVVGTITITVALSVVLHGVTAGPGAVRYGTWALQAHPIEELESSIAPSKGRASMHHPRPAPR